MVLQLPKLLRELQNDNVVRLEDIFVDTISKELVIAFEYAEYDLLVRKMQEKFFLLFKTENWKKEFRPVSKDCEAFLGWKYEKMLTEFFDVVCET